VLQVIPVNRKLTIQCEDIIVAVRIFLVDFINLGFVISIFEMKARNVYLHFDSGIIFWVYLDEIVTAMSFVL